MKSIVKTAVMLEQFDETQIAKLTSAAIAYHEAGIESGNAVKTYQEILGETPTYERYEMGRITFIESLEGEGLSEDASNKRWERLRKEMGLTSIPQSTNPDSVKKAEQRAQAREKQRAEFAGKSNEELKAEIRNLTANATLKNLDKAKQIQKEVDLRFKEETKGEEEYRKDLVKAITEWAKEQSTNDLATFALNYGLTV
jgi:hypothetical protein